MSDHFLQEATVRGKAVTGGLPVPSDLRRAALALSLARMKFGPWTESRVKVEPAMTKDNNPFFVVATDQDVVELQESVNWALRLVHDEKLVEIRRFLTDEIVRWSDAITGFNFGFYERQTLLPTPAECREEILRRLRILKALAEP